MSQLALLPDGTWDKEWTVIAGTTATRHLSVADDGRVATVTDGNIVVWTPDLRVEGAPGSATPRVIAPATSNWFHVSTEFTADGRLFLSHDGDPAGIDYPAAMVYVWSASTGFAPAFQLPGGELPNGRVILGDVTPGGTHVAVKYGATNLGVPAGADTPDPLAIVILSTGQVQQSSPNAAGNGRWGAGELGISMADDGTAVLFPRFNGTRQEAVLWRAGSTVSTVVSPVDSGQAGTYYWKASLAGSGQRAAIWLGHQVRAVDLVTGASVLAGPTVRRYQQAAFGRAVSRSDGTSWALASIVGPHGLEAASLEASCVKKEVPASGWVGHGPFSTKEIPKPTFDLNQNGATVIGGRYLGIKPRPNFGLVHAVQKPLGHVGFFLSGGIEPGFSELRAVALALEKCNCPDDVHWAPTGPSTYIETVQYGWISVPDPMTLFARGQTRFPTVSPSGSGGGALVRIDVESARIDRFLVPGPGIGLGFDPRILYDVSPSGRYVVANSTLLDLHTETETTIPATPGAGEELAAVDFPSDSTVRYAFINRQTNTSRYFEYVTSGVGNEDGRTRVAILGDSFIAGEGLFSYSEGTANAGAGDVVGEDGVTTGNNCHRSKQSWAYQAALPLVTDADTDIAFLACSGATTTNITDRVQYTGEGTPQLQRLRAFQAESPVDAVLMSIGGNDADFGGLIKECIKWWCEGSALADKIGPAAVAVSRTLAAVRQVTGSAPIYLMGYPDTTDPQTACDATQVRLANRWWAGPLYPHIWFGETMADSDDQLEVSEEELRWISDVFVPGLNLGLRRAAAEAGVHFIDATSILDGQGICSGDPWAHGIVGGKDVEILGVKAVGNETFHPNISGYAAYGRRFAQAYPTRERILHNPNPVPTPQGLTGSANAISVYVSGDSGPVAWSSDNHKVHLRNGTPGTVIALGEYSVPVELGRARVGADGSAVIDYSPPYGTRPGLHHLEVRDTADGTLLGVELVLVEGDVRCRTSEPAHDSDGDRVADGCDTLPSDGPLADADGDGVLNAGDNCPTVANAGQSDTVAGPVGDACDPALGHNPTVSMLPRPPATDADRDGVADVRDTCPAVADADQADTDADGIGDACTVDTTAPTVTGTPERSPDHGRYYTAPVTVAWTVTDPAPTAGLVATPRPTVSQGEGDPVVVVSADACDRTGNCAKGRLELPIDLTPPTITAELVPATPASGWHRQPVELTFSCSDTVSGVESCPQKMVFAGDADGQTITVVARDRAGHTTTLSTSAPKVDATAPTIAISYADRATVVGTASDVASGVDWVLVRFVSRPLFGSTRTIEAAATMECGTAGCTWRVQTPERQRHEFGWDVTAVAFDRAGNHASAVAATGAQPNGGPDR